MKRSFLFFFFLVSVRSGAQSFWDSTKTPVPDTTTIWITLNVTGLPPQINTSFGLDSVCLTLTHQFDQDVVIKLKSPDGNIITLASGNGNSGKHYIKTCFAENGTGGAIASGTPPFTGTYVPQQSLNILNNSQDPNGPWKLGISDTYSGDTGTYHNSHIHFAVNPPPDPPIPPVVCNYCTCPNNADTCDLLPDLTASSLCIQQIHLEGPGNMQISNATPNIGRGPLEIHGLDSCFCDTVPVPCTTTSCPGGKLVSHKMIQRIHQRVGSDTLVHYDIPVGYMAHHPAHGHIHVGHLADYSLRIKTPDPDARKWPIIGLSTKQGFCLMNLDDCTNALGYCKDSLGNTLTMATIPNAGFGLYSGCGLDQGIYSGYLDIYSMAENDPILFSTCNGPYYIVSVTDPDNKFLESNENNNWVAVPVILTKQAAPSGSTSFNYSVNGAQTNFTNTSPAGNVYLWDYGDGTWDTIYNASHTYATPGTYSVTLVSLNQCYTSTTQVVVITGINEYQNVDLNVHIYRNPVDENSFITWYLPQRTQVKVVLTDLLGDEVLPLLNETRTTGLQKFMMGNLPVSPGIYFLRLYAIGLGVSTVKILKIE